MLPPAAHRMRAEAQVLLCGMVVAAALWLSVTWRMWVCRKRFDIAARAPTMACLTGISSLVMTEIMLSHWLSLLAGGQGLSCNTMFWVSHVGGSGSMGLPISLRAMVILVAYDGAYRAKYARFATRRAVLKLFAAGMFTLSLVATVIFLLLRNQYTRRRYGCFYAGDMEIYLITVASFSAPATVCIKKLRRVKDAFMIRQELTLIVAHVSASLWTQLVIVALVDFGIIEDARPIHLGSEILVFSTVVVPFICSLLLPMAVLDGWCGMWPRNKQGALSESKVSPTAGATLSSSISVDKGGVLDYARDPGPVGEMFGQFCLHYMCMESWSLILDGTRYQAVSDDKEQQWCMFSEIMDEYLRSTSPQEVNISAAVRRRIAVISQREVFMGLSEEDRRAALDEPMREVVQMLEDNLLDKFRASPTMQRYMRQQDEVEHARAAGGDEDMLKLVEGFQAMQVIEEEKVETGDNQDIVRATGRLEGCRALEGWRSGILDSVRRQRGNTEPSSS